ncbi:MAG: helix-turn-helix domain-containing protein [Clostridia bacterium]|nr:helix-turn-helix domain-containing protein [Clostridia bacterium]
MICKKVSDFYTTRYRVHYINDLQQVWKNGRTWGCIDTPKREHLFLLFLQGGATYTTKNGKTITVKEGDLVYTPKGSEYHIRFFNGDGDRTETCGLRFELFDENGEDILIQADVFHFAKNKVFELFFNDVQRLTYSVPQIPVKYNCVLYTLFSELGEIESAEASDKNHFGWIQKGVEYLSTHFNEKTSVEELAKICHISAVYFRKLFKRCLGVSPVQYRSALRLKHARDYLLYGSDSVNEIAETLGYFSSAYFIKQFKEKYGCSPHTYRLKHRI